MTILWAVSVVSLALALLALMTARRTARQLASVTEMYWQLKYDHGELKAKVAPSPVEPAAPKQTFVPLTDLKRPGA